MTELPRLFGPAEPISDPSRGSLAARLERAASPDWNLDADIHIALGLAETGAEQWGPYLRRRMKKQWPPYTANLSAAVALAESQFPGIWYHIAKGKTSSDEPLFGAALSCLPAPTPSDHVMGVLTPQMIRDVAGWSQSEDELRATLRDAANKIEALKSSPTPPVPNVGR